MSLIFAFSMFSCMINLMIVLAMVRLKHVIEEVHNLKPDERQMSLHFFIFLLSTGIFIVEHIFMWLFMIERNECRRAGNDVTIEQMMRREVAFQREVKAQMIELSMIVVMNIFICC